MIVYRELSSLERDLGFRAGTLYAVSNRLSRHYRPVRLPKKGGGERLLSVPDPQLKAIQRRIAQVLLPLMPVSAYARAYRDGASTRHNALPHVGQPLVLKLDICHFFDAIRYSQVKEAAFPADMYAEPIRVLLAMLCYYKDALPQGAPTSPAVSNIILYDFDEKVGAWCRSRGIAYTRYCDDLTFSGDFDPRVVRAYIEGELRALGFLLNGQKTSVQFRSKRQSVTGLVVNDRAAVPRDYRRSLAAAGLFLPEIRGGGPPGQNRLRPAPAGIPDGAPGPDSVCSVRGAGKPGDGGRQRLDPWGAS